MQKVRVTAPYALLQAMTWGIYAVLLSYSSNYLLAKGFNGNGISLVLGVSTALSIGLQLVLAEQISRRPKLRLHIILLLIGGVLLAGCAIMLSSGIVAILAFVLACVLFQALPALVNAVGMDAVERGAPINFALARGVGSLGYSLISYLIGVLVTQQGTVVIPVAAGIVVSVFVLAVLWFHGGVERGLSDVAVEKKTTPAKQRGFLRSHKLFGLLLAGSVLLLFSHNLVCNFMLQIMQTKDGGATEQGTTNALAAVVELPVMFLFTYFLRLMRCDRWLKISGVFFAVKVLAMLLAPSVQWVYVAQIFQACGYALYSVSSVYYVESVLPGEAVRAQSYLASSHSIGSLLAMSTGGVLCEQFSAQAMMVVSIGAGVLGTVITAYAVTRQNKAVQSSI